MLRGRFGDTTGRPYIEGRIIFPRFGLHGDVSFLVDTGADTSRLSVPDAYQIGLDFSNIQRRSEAHGVGGVVQSYVESAIIVFSEPNVAIWGYEQDLEILPPQSGSGVDDLHDSLKLPSLLGREILDRWRMVYAPLEEHLTFEVLTSDFRIDRSPGRR